MRLIQELHGHVREAIASPHANYVIQKVIEVMPTVLVGFVADELQGIGVLAARHRYGCRILCRLVEHSAQTPGTVALVDEVLGAAGELCRHTFAHHVISSILEHGLAEQRHCVAQSLLVDLPRHARNRNASYVIEKALTYCSRDDRHAITSSLVTGPEQLVALAQNQFGSYVARALLKLPGEVGQKVAHQVAAAVRSAPSQLEMTRYGQRLLEDLRKLGHVGQSGVAVAGAGGA